MPNLNSQTGFKTLPPGMSNIKIHLTLPATTNSQQDNTLAPNISGPLRNVSIDPLAIQAILCGDKPKAPLTFFQKILRFFCIPVKTNQDDYDRLSILVCGNNTANASGKPLDVLARFNIVKELTNDKDKGFLNSNTSNTHVTLLVAGIKIYDEQYHQLTQEELQQQQDAKASAGKINFKTAHRIDDAVSNQLDE